jgi:hypothetical protein
LQFATHNLMLTCTASGCEGFWCSRNIRLQKSLTGACHSALKHLDTGGAQKLFPIERLRAILKHWLTSV